MTLLRPFSGQEAPLRSRTHLAADVIVVVAVAVLFWVLIRLFHGVAAPFNSASAPSSVSTDPADLPYYAARSLLRMFIALVLSTAFTFVYATAAARSRRAEKVMLPVLDVLQSVPVLGFLSVTLSMWLALFPHTELGLECASIFAIFTSQVWNMTFSFYRSLTTEPHDLDEAARILRLTKWQRFYKLDVPNGMIPLVWNGMMSFGGGWFFLIASEVISVNNRTYALPGIGSYVAAASEREQLGRLLLAVGVMIVMVVGVNVLFWRPLTAWVERFRSGDTASADVQRSWTLDLLRHSVVPGLAGRALRPLGRGLDRATRPFGVAEHRLQTNQTRRQMGDVVFASVVTAVVAVGLWRMLAYIDHSIGLSAYGTAFLVGLATFGRVVVIVVVGSIIWVPVGVWIGMNPKVTRIAQPVVQVLASFPANFLFPFFTLLLIDTGIPLNLGGIVLMALGSQWYILFNVIAGASAIPNDLREAATTLGLGRWMRWKTFIGPAVFATWVTGAITAAGGAWNASIVAEVVTYGHHTLTATGLGSYITEATASGNFPKVLVGVSVMSVYVVGLNRLFWRRLDRLAENRYTL